MKAGAVRMSARLLWRELKSGELTVLLLALLVAVAAMSSVALFSDRIEQALRRQASQLLAADLVVNSNKAPDSRWQAEAARLNLKQAEALSFPSMAVANGQATLATYKAVSDGYPLRGMVRVRLAAGEREGVMRPAAGEVWADSRLMQKLGLRLGDSLTVGNSRLQLSGELLREPDGAIDLYNFVPRLMLNQADLGATGLVQPGSRIRYRLMLAGDESAINRYQAWLKPQLGSNARLENIEEARPEVKSALERARRFLGLTALLTVMLSAAAVALATRRYLARHWQSVAVMRALGQSSGEIALTWGSLLLWLGLLAGIAGTLAGFGVQQLLLWLGRQWLGEGLPMPGLLAWASGPLSALILLAGFALPPLLALRRVPAMAVLRADVPADSRSLLAPLLAIVALLGLGVWQIGEASVAGQLMLALLAFLALVGLLAWGVVRLLAKVRLSAASGWRHGAANLARRPWLAVIQIAALAVSLMALLTLTVVRDDLLGAWQKSLPADAPDSFLINLQAGQQQALAGQFVARGLPAPKMSPMIRARLLSINGKVVKADDYQDERAKRLAEREFNLSWQDSLPAGNRVVGGEFWAAGSQKPSFSLEQGLAQTLGIRLGDEVAFDIAGQTWRAKVGSLREVSWDSFRPNFFVLGNSGWMAQQASSYITSYKAPEPQFNNRVVAALPNVTIIDIGVIVREVQSVIARLSMAVEAMFVLALAAGVLVLWAALAATRDERLYDVALLRALGASHSQVRRIVLAELMWLGGLTGLLAGGGAMAIGSLVAVTLFNLPLALNGWLPLLGMLSGSAVVGLAGWPLLRRVTATPPAEVLRNARGV